jgi:hypothetical protein
LQLLKYIKSESGGKNERLVNLLNNYNKEKVNKIKNQLEERFSPS